MNPNNLLILVSPNMEATMSPESRNRYKNFLMKIKKVGDSFPDVKFTVNKVTGNDFQKHLSTNVSSDLQTSKEKELSMNNISEALNPMFGSSRSSYQQLDNIKMIVKHARPVDESVKGSRTRAIKAIYLENSQGERFRLPINNLWAGRAMARHMVNNGTVYDVTGQRILEWAGRIGKLQKFARYAKSNGLINEGTADIMNAVTQNISDAKNILQQLSTQHGYSRFNGNIPVAPMMKAEDERVARLKETFTVKTFDESLEDTLPLIGALIMEKEQDQSGDIFAGLPEVMSVLKTVIMDKKLDPKVLTSMKSNISNPESASQLGIKASRVSSEFTGKNDTVSNFMSRMSDILDDYHNKMAFEKEKKDPRFNKALALTQAMVNAYDLGALGNDSEVTEVQTNNPMEGFKNWANLVVEGVTVSPSSSDQQKKLNELLLTPIDLGEDGVNSIGSLIGIIEDDGLNGMLSELAEADSNADARPVIVTWLKTHNMTNIIEDETKQALVKDGMEINEGFAGAALGGIAGAALGKSPKAAMAGAQLGSMAQDKLTNNIESKKKMREREMTPGEKKKREKIVKGMKKSKSGFDKRYPGRGEEVMYATATTQAMSEAEEAAPTTANMDSEVVKILTQIYNVIKEAAPSMSQEIAGHLFNANKEMVAAINAAKTVKEGKRLKKKINEAPVGVGQRLGTWARGKTAGALGPLARGWQAQIAGEKEINAAANKLGLEFRKVLGRHKIDVNSDKAVDALYNWSKRQGYPVDDPELFKDFQSAKSMATNASTSGAGVTMPAAATQGVSAPPAAGAAPSAGPAGMTYPKLGPAGQSSVPSNKSTISPMGKKKGPSLRPVVRETKDIEKNLEISENKKTIDNLIYKMVIRQDQLGNSGTAALTSAAGGAALDLGSLSAKATTPAQKDALNKAIKMLTDQGLI